MSDPRRFLPLDGPIEHHAELGSTMTRARTLLRENPSACAPGLSIVADVQHQGRGRSGRTWQSLPRFGLYTTVLVPLPDLSAAAGLSLVSGYAALQSAKGLIEAPHAAKLQLKWPNDVIACERKLAGILIELETDSRNRTWALVGLGVNLVEHKRLPSWATGDDGRYIGLCDLMATGGTERFEALRDTVLARFRLQLSSAFGDVMQRGFAAFVPKLEPYHALLGQRVCAQYHGKEIEGIAQAIGPQGELMVQTQGETLALIAGEVAKIRPNA